MTIFTLGQIICDNLDVQSTDRKEEKEVSVIRDILYITLVTFDSYWKAMSSARGGEFIAGVCVEDFEFCGLCERKVFDGN
jgi:hypothetical protein